MIKVIAKNTVQAIEIIEAFKDTSATLTIEIKNTTATNIDEVTVYKDNNEVVASLEIEHDVQTAIMKNGYKISVNGQELKKDTR